MAAEAVQKSAEWIPLVQSAIVGIFTVAGAFVAQWWAVRRDLKTKAAVELEKRAQKRADRQIEALFALQDALVEMAPLVTALAIHKYKSNIQFSEILSDQKALLPIFLRFKCCQARIESEEVHRRSLELSALVRKITTLQEKEAGRSAETDTLQYGSISYKLNEAIGVELRTLNK